MREPVRRDVRAVMGAVAALLVVPETAIQPVRMRVQAAVKGHRVPIVVLAREAVQADVREVVPEAVDSAVRETVRPVVREVATVVVLTVAIIAASGAVKQDPALRPVAKMDVHLAAQQPVAQVVIQAALVDVPDAQGVELDVYLDAKMDAQEPVAPGVPVAVPHPVPKPAGLDVPGLVTVVLEAAQALVQEDVAVDVAATVTVRVRAAVQQPARQLVIQRVKISATAQLVQ